MIWLVLLGIDEERSSFPPVLLSPGSARHLAHLAARRDHLIELDGLSEKSLELVAPYTYLSPLLAFSLTILLAMSRLVQQLLIKVQLGLFRLELKPIRLLGLLSQLVREVEDLCGVLSLD